MFLDEPLFVLVAKDLNLEMELTPLDLQSIYKITKKRNSALYKKLTVFLDKWEQKVKL